MIEYPARHAANGRVAFLERERMEAQLQPLKIDPAAQAARPIDVAWRGVELCRQGDWQEGMYWLTLAAGVSKHARQLPGVFFAYFGYGLARYEGKRQEGLAMCQRAVELEFYQPESYLLLAQASFLCGDRRAALDVVERGLEIDAGNDDLLTLRRDLGLRRAPIVPFLSRHSLLNRMLGQMRHRLLGTRRKAKS